MITHNPEGVNTFLRIYAPKKNYPIDPIYFGHLNVDREKFWTQIIAPTNFNVSRCTDEMSGSILHLKLTTFTSKQHVSLSVKSNHPPQSCSKATNIGYAKMTKDELGQYETCVYSI